MAVKVTIEDFQAGAEPKMFGKRGGGTVARVNVASNGTGTDQAGNQTTETTWLLMAAFGPTARFLEANVHKGSRLEVEGELHNRDYEKDGVKHTVSEVHVIPGRGKVALLGSAPKG